MKGNLIFTTEAEGVVLLKIIGDFTNETTPQYQKICNELMKEQHVHGIVLDFEEVLSIDTSAFACMINFIKEHAEKNVKIAIIHIQEQQKAMLEILRIENEISYYGSKEEVLLQWKSL